ncbi:MAG TPA: tetratricopeptide repeat protein, partial [Ktedonobacteraceae bacterium]|nr:tetratricopeptide repeat protein [Ktedonobacteraceae bacterium]
MDTPFAPIEVFYASAEADTLLLEQLERHLSILRHEGQITTWHRRQTVAGSDWQEELDQHLNTASLILLLISPDFLASNYQHGVELQRAMQRHNANEACVIPIVLRACDWEGASFDKLQVVPRNGKAITSWRNSDEAFAEVAREIRVALQAMQRLTVNTPAMALPKIWQIPYQRNPVFTGRDDLLHTLTDLLQTGQSAVLSQPQTQAISGLGGIGKTQLAVEYAYRTSQKYQAVFWVSAETQETLVSGYVTLAEALHLREKEEQDQNVIVQLIRHWLQTHTHWLLILDNADNLSLVAPLLPPVYGGQVLLTTRAHTTGRFAHRIEISTLTNAEGSLLLLRRAGVLAEQGALEEASEQEVALARQISAALGDLPLALEQAGAYIEETQCSLSGYLDLYHEHQTDLLERRGQITTDYPASVVTTWSLSFKKIEQENPSATDLLQICAFLAPEDIPEEIFILGASEFGPNLACFSKSTLKLDEAIEAVLKFSLLQRNPHTRTLNIHRLVQAVLKMRMSQDAQFMWAKRVVRAVSSMFPKPDIATWPQCRRMLSHAQQCIILIEQYHWTSLETLLLLKRTGEYLHSRAQYQEAEHLYRHILVIDEHMQGTDHPSTAVTLEILGVLYQEQGRYKDAETYLQRALAIREQTLGASHPDTATTLSSLGNLYRALCWYKVAETYSQRALMVKEQVLGIDHPST